MPTQSRAKNPRGDAPGDHAEPVTSPAVDAMVEAVIAFASGRPARHTAVAGGFGAGKSYALGRATEVALGADLRVSTLERGPLGISSYADFLVAVAKATRPSDRARLEVDAWRRELSNEAHELDLPELERRALPGADDARIVIVIESVDQLLHQVRSTDRPRIVELLTRPVAKVLVLGTVHGTGLAEELGDDVQFVQATYLSTVEAGSMLALQEAQRLGADKPKLTARRLRDASVLDPAVKSNWLFWSLVGRYLVIARRDPLRWAEEDLRSRAASHFDAMLLMLAPSEQRVLLALAEAGGPRTVGELADTIGVRNQAAATALGRLHADDWVRIAEMPSEPDRRRTWYDIADPLLRLHLIPAPDGRR